jgi:hypothetical protein
MGVEIDPFFIVIRWVVVCHNWLLVVIYVLRFAWG